MARGLLVALAVLAATACAQTRGMMTGSGTMSGKSSGGGGGGASDNAVFSRGRATSGDAYLAVYTVQFDTPPAQVDADMFRSTVASFFKLDTSQILINRVYPMDSGSAVDFFALFPDDDAAESFDNAISDPQRLRAVFASTPTLSNPRLVSSRSGDSSSSSSAAPAPRASAGTTITSTGGGGGVGTGGSGGSASGEGASPGSPGYGTPGAPGTVTTSGGR